jgi:hypothetical protein
MSDSDEEDTKILKRGRKPKIHPEAMKSNGKVDMALNGKIKNKRGTELSKLTTAIGALNKYSKSENVSFRLIKIPNDSNKIDKVLLYTNCSIDSFDKRLYEMLDSFTVIDPGNIYSDLLSQKEKNLKNHYLPPNSEIVGHKSITLPNSLSELGLKSTKKKKIEE